MIFITNYKYLFQDDLKPREPILIKKNYYDTDFAKMAPCLKVVPNFRHYNSDSVSNQLLTLDEKNFDRPSGLKGPKMSQFKKQKLPGPKNRPSPPHKTSPTYSWISYRISLRMSATPAHPGTSSWQDYNSTAPRGCTPKRNLSYFL